MKKDHKHIDLHPFYRLSSEYRVLIEVLVAMFFILALSLLFSEAAY